MGTIYRELIAEAEERQARSAFEAWMTKRGTPLCLEQTQAYEAFKAGMSHQACMAAAMQFQAEGRAADGVQVKEPTEARGGAEPSGETMEQREEVCAAWASLPDDLRKHSAMTRLYHALGGPNMDNPVEPDGVPASDKPAPASTLRDGA